MKIFLQESDHFQTLIDHLMISSELTMSLELAIISNSISDHEPQILKMNAKICKQHQPDKFYTKTKLI